MMDEKSRHADVIAVTSGKGGVGKTNIAGNLAICLAAAGRKVVLMDADLGLGNLDVIMNINSRYNLSHVVSGQKTLDQITHIGPAGVEIICGGSGLEELANLSPFQRKHLIDELDALQDRADIIVIDTGAGINASVLGFCQASHHTIVVTTPEPTAMTDAYAVIKVLAGKKYDGRISLIVNMADSVAEGKKIYRQIADVAQRFLDIPVYEAGILCRDERLVSAVKSREPVVLAYPRARITTSLVAMTARLARGPAAGRGTEGFFQKVVNWFF
ncbi:MAG: MinD/ParA family protein [Sedimentisphaerales bacterium]|nr:MinD/ParA family protein [Sedimentisphaerales bacterium]